MKKNLFFHLSALIVLMVLVSACSKQAEYAQAIPADATEVAAIHLKTLAEKSGVRDKENKEIVAKIVDALKNDVKASTFQQLEAVIKDPAKSGIDVAEPVYLFNLPTAGYMAAVAKIGNEDDLASLLEATEREGLNTSVTMNEGCNFTTVNDDVLLAFNASTLLALNYGTASQLAKAKEVAVTLLKQEAENSIVQTVAFKKMQKMGGDVNLFISPYGMMGKYFRQMNYGLSGDVDLKELKMVGGLSFEKGKIELRIENCTDNAELKTLLDKQIKSTRPIQNALLKYFPKSTIALLSVGVNGEEFYNILQENEQFRNEFSITKAAELKELFGSFDGDVTAGLVNVTMMQNPTFLAYATIKDNAPLKAIYEKKNELGLKRGEDIVKLNEDDYVYKSKQHSLFFGIRDKQLYITNDELLYKGIGKVSEPSVKECNYASGLKGNRTAVVVNAEAVLELPVVKLLVGFGGTKFASYYTLAGQISYMEAVGDGEKMTFTMQMKDKDVNALKQIVNIFKSNIGI